MNSINFEDKKQLEKYSSIFTLSDMELFIFPELFYPLVIANIMSPIIWDWRNDKWFKDINKKSFTYKINRIKQFIMDNYEFNLDLETWGLTTKEKEISRFQDFFDIELLRQSNALFGYEGDKYYFDIDIRKHFGLEKYTDDVIPYWKTETVEAMSAFQYKNGFRSGAGECVSLSALYAAALFVIGEIPLEKIYLIATPLHSQNFISINEGFMTNNRRIVTKNMWYNGTLLSSKARRALENEVVTIVSHISGYIHTVYSKATIDEKHYDNFKINLHKFLKTELTFQIFINFLCQDTKYLKMFQYEHVIDEKPYFINLEKLLEYENKSNFCFAEKSRDKLLLEIDIKEFSTVEDSNLILINCIENFLSENKNMTFTALKDYFLSNYNDFNCGNLRKEYFVKVKEMFESLEKFIELIPKLPVNSSKNFQKEELLQIGTTMQREEILEYIFGMASQNKVAELATYTFRQMNKISWKPFFKAALERNPVSVINSKNSSVTEIYNQIYNFPNSSIYDSERLAQPDEVWNFGVGDGIEKAILMANILYNSFNYNDFDLLIDKEKVTLKNSENNFYFDSKKNFSKQEKITFRT